MSRRDWEAHDALKEKRGPNGHAVDVRRSRFPFSIVWSPIPCITYILPFVGHLGVTDSRGVIYDFAGSHFISIDDFTFGYPTRVLPLDPALITKRTPGRTAVEDWDAAVDAANNTYSTRVHNIICDNCHSHVARCLNVMGYGGRDNWNMVVLAAWMFFAGKWISVQRALVSWLPFVLICVVVILLATLVKA